MNKGKFKSLITMAQTFQKLDSKRSEFYKGFQRGLRKLFHGSKFGTEEEHEKFINIADGEYRKDLQTGYRVGYYYNDLIINNAEDIQPIRKKLGLSTQDIAEITKVSTRTVEGWEQGRPISSSALKLLKNELLISFKEVDEE